MKKLSLVVGAIVMSLAAISGCKSEVKANVSCKGAAEGMNCEVSQTLGDSKVTVTWDIKAVCKNGTVVTGEGTGEVSGGGKVNVLVPNSKLANDEKCDAAESMTIENLKIVPAG